MKLHAVPAFSDNYIWMLDNGAQALVVDPGDAAPVNAALDALGLELVGILVTHHHADHVGGIDALRPRLRGPVWGPAGETMPQPCTPLFDGDTVDVMGLRFAVLDVPGHTSGHIAYVQISAGDLNALSSAQPSTPSNPYPAAPWLFCGDTLFSGGCGRLFEGTPQQMAQSLARLAALPADTQVCCTHEYTLSNLRFALAVEPENRALQAYHQRCTAQRAQGLPTLPSSIGLENQINPFLRCSQAYVVAKAQDMGATSADPVAVFAALREWKNRF